MPKVSTKPAYCQREKKAKMTTQATLAKSMKPEWVITTKPRGKIPKILPSREIKLRPLHEK